MIFGPQRTVTLTGLTTGEYGVCTRGNRVWMAWANGTSIVVAASTTYGLSFGAPVTVNTNAANFAVVLNEPFVCDPVTGTLYLVWERNEGQAGSPPSLYLSKSTDNGATWSAAVTVDDGTAHANNRFFRVGVVAYNGVVHVGYTTISSSAFTTDGLWHVQSTDSGATFGTPATLYTVGTAGEPNSVAFATGDLLMTWYDSGVNANAGGDLYCTTGTWSASGYTFAASKTRITTGQTCGRPRPTVEGQTVVVVTNTNWGGSVADVAIVRSTDGGATWGAVTTLATHTTGALDHPDVAAYGDVFVALWIDQGTSSYMTSKSTDAGATWALFANPFTSTSTSDAPKLRVTSDVLIAYGNGVKYSYYPIGCPDPASTATTVLDAFTRADENPLSGGGVWSADASTGESAGLKLVSNAVTRQSGAGTFDRAGSYRTDITASVGYDTFCTIASGANGEVDLLFVDPVGKNGYKIGSTGTDFTAGYTLGRLDATVDTDFGVGDTTRGLTASDKFLLRLTPSYVAVYRNEGSGWREVNRAADTTYRASLRPAMSIAGFGSAGPTADDFGGNALSAPSNSVAPVASGTVGSTLSVTSGTWTNVLGVRYTYQWQSSAAGAGVWSNISRAVLPTYDSSADSTKDYRCVVTATTSLGAVTANSNTRSPAAAGSLHHCHVGLSGLSLGF